MSSMRVMAGPDDPLRLLPKVELHCHVEGTARATTVAELAAKHGIPLGVATPEDLYEYSSLADFLAAFGTVCSAFVDRDDFHRMAYEAVEDAAIAGTRYREMFVSPGFHLDRGVRFDTFWEGIAAGVADGEHDFGVTTKMIIDIDKPKGLGPALAVLEAARHLDRDLLLGIGGDSTEAGVDHLAFEPLIREAHNLGFKTCFHCGEDGPAENIAVMVEAGVDRIDHGTRLLDLPELVDRIVEEQIPLTSCPSSNVELEVVASLEEHPFAQQLGAGALVTLNSDDPAFFRFDLADEFARVAAAFDFGFDDMVAIRDRAIDASWLDDIDKASLRAEFAS
ncbi:MAG: adenosine deaminase [Actinomycetota bacterium]